MTTRLRSNSDGAIAIEVEVEVEGSNDEPELRPLLERGISSISIMGTVRLTENSIGEELIYLPTPTPDPRGNISNSLK